MMLGNLNGWHLVILLAVILLLFGATRLPALSKSMAQSMRIFKNESRADTADTPDSDPASAPPLR
ncbi:twin-arginine translocase TatA/TatE family subunit [Herbiconiux ginsengi]